MKLVYTNGNLAGYEVKRGHVITDRDNSKVEVYGWEEPLHRASSGRVYIIDEKFNIRTYFPHVFDMAFEEIE